ncbi:uncharacterized protein MONOS_6648 [Monocercomonoides exilis]|uniref:uncharacterized protein n=1 Tax=Monocercomonoides exilis TaxID=2049356 RepID=UPI003559BC38|nr:hypothetical protein MONOS_6648 [Monocercomonoides exilis]|eukprot:MONOS_6648.1-p1 / transcript=MONOS_6648.1 / gene=MONOS_6648 / organism=Monocercomonoides_exilis_PA203 / gene_product=unspecified product / transcript_product=unspecified product / location=Mono_scaffold00213:41827-45592(-) / protein_length=1235 / sequence_SO=supercontig / SO=protein_coding / is_pseudo=false
MSASSCLPASKSLSEDQVSEELNIITLVSSTPEGNLTETDVSLLSTPQVGKKDIQTDFSPQECEEEKNSFRGKNSRRPSIFSAFSHKFRGSKQSKSNFKSPKPIQKSSNIPLIPTTVEGVCLPFDDFEKHNSNNHSAQSNKSEKEIDTVKVNKEDSEAFPPGKENIQAEIKNAERNCNNRKIETEREKESIRLSDEDFRETNDNCEIKADATASEGKQSELIDSKTFKEQTSDSVNEKVRNEKKTTQTEINNSKGPSEEKSNKQPKRDSDSDMEISNEPKKGYEGEYEKSVKFIEKEKKEQKKERSNDIAQTPKKVELNNEKENKQEEEKERKVETKEKNKADEKEKNETKKEKHEKDKKKGKKKAEKTIKFSENGEKAQQNDNNDYSCNDDVMKRKDKKEERSKDEQKQGEEISEEKEDKKEEEEEEVKEEVKVDDTTDNESEPFNEETESDGFCSEDTSEESEDELIETHNTQDSDKPQSKKRKKSLIRCIYDFLSNVAKRSKMNVITIILLVTFSVTTLFTLILTCLIVFGGVFPTLSPRVILKGVLEVSRSTDPHVLIKPSEGSSSYFRVEQPSSVGDAKGHQTSILQEKDAKHTAEATNTKDEVEMVNPALLQQEPSSSSGTLESHPQLDSSASTQKRKEKEKANRNNRPLISPQFHECNSWECDATGETAVGNKQSKAKLYHSSFDPILSLMWNGMKDTLAELITCSKDEEEFQTRMLEFRLQTVKTRMKNYLTQYFKLSKYGTSANEALTANASPKHESHSLAKGSIPFEVDALGFSVSSAAVDSMTAAQLNVESSFATKEPQMKLGGFKIDGEKNEISVENGGMKFTGGRAAGDDDRKVVSLEDVDLDLNGADVQNVGSLAWTEYTCDLKEMEVDSTISKELKAKELNASLLGAYSMEVNDTLFLKKVTFDVPTGNASEARDVGFLHSLISKLWEKVKHKWNTFQTKRKVNKDTELKQAAKNEANEMSIEHSPAENSITINAPALAANDVKVEGAVVVGDTDSSSGVISVGMQPAADAAVSIGTISDDSMNLKSSQGRTKAENLDKVSLFTFGSVVSDGGRRQSSSINVGTSAAYNNVEIHLSEIHSAKHPFGSRARTKNDLDNGDVNTILLVKTTGYQGMGTAQFMISTSETGERKCTALSQTDAVKLAHCGKDGKTPTVSFFNALKTTPQGEKAQLKLNKQEKAGYTVKEPFERTDIVVDAFMIGLTNPLIRLELTSYDSDTPV